jgi:hypothetical protein
MQSTGQGGRHSSHPVQRSASTVCISFAAPTIASTDTRHAQRAADARGFVDSCDGGGDGPGAMAHEFVSHAGILPAGVAGAWVEREAGYPGRRRVARSTPWPKIWHRLAVNMTSHRHYEAPPHTCAAAPARERRAFDRARN